MNHILLSVFIQLGCLVSAAYPNTVIPGYLAKATLDARQVGLALRVYADDHGGKLPASLSDLNPDYLPDDRSQRNMQITTPNLLLRDLPEDCIIAIRTVPENGRYLVAVYSTLSATVLMLAPGTSTSTPDDWRNGLLISILGGVSGWIVALTLWIRHPSKPSLA